MSTTPFRGITLIATNQSQKEVTANTAIAALEETIVAPPINVQTGTSYSLVLTDAGKVVRLTNSSAIALTIPANSSVAFPIGTQIVLAQGGAGQVTVGGAGGVTIRTPETLKLRKQYAQAALIKVATDEWMLEGNLEAA